MNQIFDLPRKMWFHMPKVAEFMRTGKTTPILVEILPTNTCQAKCPWCFYVNTKDNRMIDENTMLKALKDMKELGVNAINWTGGGEPTIHPNFKEFTRLANYLGLKQGLFTNAIDPKAVEPSWFDWIRISHTDRGFFDGLDKTIRKWTQFTKVGYCINLVSDYNTDQLQKIALKVINAQADYLQVRPALSRVVENQYPIDKPDVLKDFEVSFKEYRGFKVYLSEHKFNDYLILRDYTQCYGCWFCPTIDFNGKLMVCEYWLDNPNYELGDLNKKSFKEIWESERTTTVMNSLTNLSRCQHCCRNHELNKFLAKLKEGCEDADFL